MFKVDKNNQITRISDGKIIPRDVTNPDYQLFLYVQAFRIDPNTKQAVNIQSEVR